MLKQIDSGGVVTIVPRGDLASAVAKYCKSALAKSDQFQLTARECEAAVDYWCYSTEPAQTPRVFSWPDEEGLTFTRLPWRAEPGPTPTWDRLLKRMSNTAAFCAWLGSIFDRESANQQYVWIMGEGNDGKGALNRFLRRVFGPGYQSKQPPGRHGDKFWTHGLLGKRLVVFPDCNDTEFVTSGLFKSLTGGDPVSVEVKGAMAYTAKLDAKYLIVSNERPDLSSSRADLRRVIYCEMEERSKGSADDLDFEEKLWREGGAFLSRCITEYEPYIRLVSIPTEVEKIEDWVDGHEDSYLEVFEFYFELDEKEAAKDLWLPGEQVQRTLKRAFKSPESRRDFLRWMERKYKVRRMTVELGSGEGRSTPKRYRYLKLKNAMKDTARSEAVN